MRGRRRRGGALVTLMIAAAASAGCSDGVAPGSIRGVYQLITVDDQALPVDLPDGSSITGGELELGRDEIDLAITYSTGVVRMSGEWARGGISVAVTWSDGSLEFMTLVEAAGQITRTDGNSVFVFQR